jgi:hypothetical protein
MYAHDWGELSRDDQRWAYGRYRCNRCGTGSYYRTKAPRFNTCPYGAAIPNWVGEASMLTEVTI